MIFYRWGLAYSANWAASSILYLAPMGPIIRVTVCYFLQFWYYRLIANFDWSVKTDIFVINHVINAKVFHMVVSLLLYIEYYVFYIICEYVVLFSYAAHRYEETYMQWLLPLQSNHQNYVWFFSRSILCNLSIFISIPIFILAVRARDLAYVHIYEFLYGIIGVITFLSYGELHIHLFLFGKNLIIFLSLRFQFIYLRVEMMFFKVYRAAAEFISIFCIDLPLLKPTRRKNK